MRFLLFIGRVSLLVKCLRFCLSILMWGCPFLQRFHFHQCEQSEKSGFADEFLELSLFFKAFRALYSELICIFPCFCPYEYFTRESFCEMYLIVACHFI